MSTHSGTETRGGGGVGVRTALVVAGLVVLNIPFLTAVWTSVRSNAAIGSGPFALLGGVSAEHFVTVWSGVGFDLKGFYLNSIFVSLGTSALVTVIAFPAAFAIMRLGVGGTALLRIATSLRILPIIFFVIPLYLLLAALGLLDTIAALIIANSFLNMPLAVLILSSSLAGFPTELEDAALVDGLGPGRIMLQITLPLTRPAIASVAMLTFLFAWSEYMFALTLTSSAAVPLTVGTANFVTSAGVRWGEIAAATVLAVVPPMLLAVFAQRHLVRGLTAGAVKG